MRVVVSLLVLTALSGAVSAKAVAQAISSPSGEQASAAVVRPSALSLPAVSLPEQRETLERLTQQLLERSPWQERWSRQAALAAAETQAAQPLPQLSLTLDAQLRPGAQEQSARVGYTLPSWAQQEAHREAALARQEAQQAVILHEQLTQVLQLHRLAYEALAFQAQLQRLPQRIQALQQLERVAQQRAESGLISRLDALRLQGEAAQLEGNRTRLQTELLSTLVALQGLLGLPAPVQVEGNLDQPLPLPALAELQAQLEQQPSFRAQRSEQRAQQAVVQGLRGGRLAGTQLEAGLWRVADGTPGPLGMGVGLSVPLTSGLVRQKALALEQARLLGLESTQRQQLQQARAMLEGAQLQRSAEQVRVQWLFEVQLPRAQELLRLTQLSYEAGEQPLSTLIEAFHLVAATEQNGLEAQLALRHAELRLAEVAGSLPTRSSPSTQAEP